MEVNTDSDGAEDDEEEVENMKDVAMLDQLCLGNEGDGDH